MATYKDLQDRIQLDYLNRYDLTGAVKRAIKNTIKCYEGTRFWFNETASSTTTTANQSYFGVPSDFLSLDLLQIRYSGADTKLHEVSFEEVREMNASSATSVPTHFAYRQDRFNLALIPDSAYTVTCHYIHSLPELSADSDSNVWTNEGANLIAHGATIELMSSILQVGDDGKIYHHANMLRMALTEMRIRNETRLAGKLRPTHF